MNTPELFDDPLFDFELKIARRADELSRREHSTRTPLEVWIEAERDVLEARAETASAQTPLH